jgi:predicted DNA-binding WGR domain protein
MARFYSLHIERDLFGGVVLRRQWGRIGTAGRTRLDTHEGEQAAREALERIETAKRRRGYSVLLDPLGGSGAPNVRNAALLAPILICRAVEERFALRRAHRQHGRDLALMPPLLGPGGDVAARKVGIGGVVSHGRGVGQTATDLKGRRATVPEVMRMLSARPIGVMPPPGAARRRSGPRPGSHRGSRVEIGEHNTFGVLYEELTLANFIIKPGHPSTRE